MPFITFGPNSENIRANTIYCLGRNYAEHARELNNPVPSKPMVFLKPNSALELTDGVIELPAESNDVHHEVELVILIGKKGKSIPKEQAWEFVKGVGIGIDFTARDIQQQAKEKGHPWTLAKGFHTFAPVSHFLPFLQPASHQVFELELHINGQKKQHGFTSDMIFTIPEIVAYISHFSTLQEGDLIFTGTPEGVGPVKSGDVLTASLNKGLLELNLTVA